jgi:hypothetical protein
MTRDPFQIDQTYQDPETQPPEFLSDIPVADWAPAERKPDRRKREKAYFIQLIPENKTRLERLATRLQVPRYELVRYLLSYSLAAYRTGELQLEHQLTHQGLSLYPLQAKRRRRKTYHQLQKTSVRGLPEELWQVLKNIAEIQLDVPLWQVINRFLEHAFASYDSGKLSIQPEAVSRYSLYG